MASTSEVGHAKNIANFHDLITFCQGYGTSYNPTKNSLKISQLLSLKTTAQNQLAAVIPVSTAFNNAVNERIAAFNGLKALSTRIINAIQSTDAVKEKIDDAKGYNKKIQGKRAATTQPAIAPGATPPQTISTSQQSYDQLIQHFEGLISVLQSETTYAPNEVDLQIDTLNTKLATMKSKNDEIASAYTEVSNARLSRNNVLYNETNGLVATAAEVKNYVKSIFGTTSPQYKQVSRLRFTKISA